MATAKEECFEKAIDKLNEGRAAKNQPKLEIEHRQGWIRDAGNWKPEGWTGKLWHSIRKTFRILDGNQAPRPPGSANPEQYRVPDITLTLPGGKKIVLDTKFTNAEGKPDGWRTQTGMGGTTQRPDYEDINEQQGTGVGEPSLDKDKCDCGKRKLETETIQVPVPALESGNQFFFVMPPGGVPLPASGPVSVPAGAGGLLPEFVFP
jgi:hypothetical protein